MMFLQFFAVCKGQKMAEEIFLVFNSSKEQTNSFFGIFITHSLTNCSQLSLGHAIFLVKSQIPALRYIHFNKFFQKSISGFICRPLKVQSFKIFWFHKLFEQPSLGYIRYPCSTLGQSIGTFFS